MDSDTPALPSPVRLSREDSKRLTRERLLDAAEQVFAELGFHGASVEAVAERAGFSKGAIYSNFGGKDDLFLALFDRRLERWTPQFQMAFARSSRADTVSLETLVQGAQGQGLAWTRLELEFFLYAMRDETAKAKLSQRYAWIRKNLSTALEGQFADHAALEDGGAEVLSWVLPALSLGLDIWSGASQESPPPKLWGQLLRRLFAEDEG